MKNTLNRFIKRSAVPVLLFIYLSLGTAHATLYTPYIDSVGEYFTDSTGLDWLNLRHAQNKSYNYVSARFGETQEFDGYRYATSIELSDLVTAYTGVPTPSELTFFDESTSFDQLVQLLGNTYNGNPSNDESLTNFSYGIIITDGHVYNHHNTSELKDNNESLPYANSDSYVKQNSSINDDYDAIEISSFLVRETTVVPAPPAIILMLSALLGLFGLTRRKAI